MDSIDTVVERFRDAALLPARWSSTLDDFGRAFDSDGATLVLKSVTRNGIAVSSSIRPFLPIYFSGRYRDPREDRVNPRPEQGFMPDLAYFSAKEISRDPYYQEFMRPRGFGWNATAILHGDLIISVKRAFDRGPYEDGELKALNATLPCLRSVSRVACITWASRFDGQLEAFDRLDRGAILLDLKGRVLSANRSVRWGDGFNVCDGRLKAVRNTDQARLQAFIAALLAPRWNDPSATTLALPRPSGARPWILDGIGLSEAVASMHSNAAAMVMITDMELPVRTKLGRLSLCFGLTDTESSLACKLVAGCSLQQAAADLAISEGHARQRLKSVFQKTRTSRQAELVALLAKLD